jgi:hypothetical protein
MAYTAIDIGAGAANYDSTTSKTNTYVDLTNPANATGILTSVQAWTNAIVGTGTHSYIGTFSGSGSTYTNRDVSSDLGNIATGDVRTFTGQNIDVTTGDFLGFYGTSSTTFALERNTSGGSGVYYKSGNQFGAGEQTGWTSQANAKLAVYATGLTVPDAPTSVSATDDLTDKVTITWTAGTGETGGHRVYRDTVDISGIVATGTNTYDDTTAVAGTTYSYTVKSRNAAGLSVASAADNGIRVIITLTVADSAHVLNSEAPTLVQHQILAVNASAHALNSETPNLTEHKILSVIDSSHGLASETPTLIELRTLAINDGVHNIVSETPTLNELRTLTVADSVHVLNSETPTLIELRTLAVNDSIHALNSDSVILNELRTLEVSDSIHNTVSDNVDLGAALIVNDSVHSVVSDSPALIQNCTIIVQDGTHTFRSDDPTLIQNFTLSVNNSVHQLISTTIGSLEDRHIFIVEAETGEFMPYEQFIKKSTFGTGIIFEAETGEPFMFINNQFVTRLDGRIK